MKEFAETLKIFDKCLSVIFSCRTMEHIEVAERMVQNFFVLFPNYKTNSLSLYLKKRKETIRRYFGTLEGDKVITISNECVSVNVGIITAFTDFDRPNQDYLPHIQYDDGKEYLCMGVVLPFSEELQESLTSMNYKARWEFAVELRRKMNSPSV